MTRNVEAYMIISEPTAADLIEEVNKLISDGWEPFYGIAVSEDDYTMSYVQAIVRYCP